VAQLTCTSSIFTIKHAVLGRNKSTGSQQWVTVWKKQIRVLWYKQVYISFKIINPGFQNFPRNLCHLKSRGKRSLTSSNFHTEDPQILGAIISVLLSRPTLKRLPSYGVSHKSTIFNFAIRRTIYSKSAAV